MTYIVNTISTLNHNCIFTDTIVLHGLRDVVNYLDETMSEYAFEAHQEGDEITFNELNEKRAEIRTEIMFRKPNENVRFETAGIIFEVEFL